MIDRLMQFGVEAARIDSSRVELDFDSTRTGMDILPTAPP
jgi:hypothetical protein